MNDFEPPLIRSLHDLLGRPPKVGGAGLVEQFVLRYIFFEAALREVLSRYLMAEPARSRSVKSDGPIRIDVVFKCFSHFTVIVPQDTVEALLASKANSRGSKSARNLRNALVHQWKVEDAKEVESRGAELLSHLSIAIKAISDRLPNSNLQP